MTRTSIITRTAAIALGAFLTLHQPASAGIASTLETATAGGASWTYTAGATGRRTSFAPIQGTDWLGGSQDATPVSSPSARPAARFRPFPSPAPSPCLASRCCSSPPSCAAAAAERRPDPGRQFTAFRRSFR